MGIKKTLSNISSNQNIISKINEINIPSNNQTKKILKEKQFLISNNIEFYLLPDEKELKLLFLKKLNIESKINDIIIIFDNNKELKKLKISSKINDIYISSIKKEINYEICSNNLEINILQNNIRKEIIFKIENEFFQFFSKNKKENKINKIEETIIENYINTINLGFDKGKEYDNYNIINKEKDEDSDNENDRLECEPIPSFLLCIQKKNKIKQN